MRPAVYLFFATMLTSVSCNGVSTVEEKTAQPVPSKWQHRVSSQRPMDTLALATWWKRFDDPVLDHIILAALQTNTDLRTALSRITEYRAQRGVERAALFPTLDLDLSGRGSKIKNNSSHLTTTTESYQTVLRPSWEVDLFGKQRLNLLAAKADLAQVHEDFYASQVVLTAELASAYVVLRSAEAQLTVVENSLGTRRETVQLTQWSEQAGTGNALNTQQSISTLEQARASMPTLKLSIEQARNQLALLSGRTPGSLDALLAKPRRLPVVPNHLTIGIPAETLRQRPDVRAAEHAVTAAIARTKATQRERLPSLNLSGSLGIEALQAGRLFSPQSIAGSMLGTLAAPIFNAGRIQNRITIQNERTKQAIIAYEATVLTALAEVENALIAVQRFNQRLNYLALAITAARQSVTLSGMQFKAGEIDLLVSLDNQRTLLSLEQQEVITRADRATACIQLFKALGGGWSPQTP